MVVADFVVDDVSSMRDFAQVRLHPAKVIPAIRHSQVQSVLELFYRICHVLNLLLHTLQLENIIRRVLILKV